MLTESFFGIPMNCQRKGNFKKIIKSTLILFVIFILQCFFSSFANDVDNISNDINESESNVGKIGLDYDVAKYYLNGTIEFKDDTKVVSDETIYKDSVLQISVGFWEYVPSKNRWKYFLLDENGNRKHYKNEWVEIENEDKSTDWYIVDDDEYIINGWVKYNGDFYYCTFAKGNFGKLAKGEIEIDNNIYNFDYETGELLSDIIPEHFEVFGAENHKSDIDGIWETDEETSKKRFVKEVNTEDGVIKEPVVGWYMIDGYYYYFDENGDMVTGLIDIDGVYYYFEPDGKMLEGGERLVDGVIYVFDKATGACQSSRVDLSLLS